MARRRRWDLALALGVFAAALNPAFAQKPQDCGGRDPGRWLAGCTALINNARTKAPERARALKYRGIAHFQAGSLDGAIADFTAVIAINPRDAAGSRIR